MIGSDLWSENEVPGVPVYLFAGIIIADKCPLGLGPRRSPGPARAGHEPLTLGRLGFALEASRPVQASPLPWGSF